MSDDQTETESDEREGYKIARPAKFDPDILPFPRPFPSMLMPINNNGDLAFDEPRFQ